MRGEFLSSRVEEIKRVLDCAVLENNDQDNAALIEELKEAVLKINTLLARIEGGK